MCFQPGMIERRSDGRPRSVPVGLQASASRGPINFHSTMSFLVGTLSGALVAGGVCGIRSSVIQKIYTTIGVLWFLEYDSDKVRLSLCMVKPRCFRDRDPTAEQGNCAGSRFMDVLGHHIPLIFI